MKYILTITNQLTNIGANVHIVGDSDGKFTVKAFCGMNYFEGCLKYFCILFMSMVKLSS